MNKEIKERWVKALRSGEYKQGGGQLKIGDRFCCLGVLCDLVKDEVGGVWEGNSTFQTREESRSMFLPDEVMKLSELLDDQGRLGFEVQAINASGEVVTERSLSSLNDSEVSFPIIAGIIEKYL